MHIYNIMQLDQCMHEWAHAHILAQGRAHWRLAQGAGWSSQGLALLPVATEACRDTYIDTILATG